MNFKKITNFLAAIALLSIAGFSVKAQTWTTDSTFNGWGIKQFTFYNNIDRGFGCALQQDQKLVLAGLSKNPSSGSFELCFTRLNVDGSFDSTFNGTGKSYVSMGNQGSIGGQTPQIRIASDGKIVAVNTGRAAGGTSQDIMVCRLDSTGVIDNTFNSTGVLFVDMTGGGTQPDEANGMDIDAGGNIWAVGATRTGGSPLDNDFAIIKVTPAGTLDPSFDGDGMKLYNPTGFAEFGTGIKAQADGKIVFGGAAGGNSMIIRMDSTGVLDPTFNGTGKANVSFSSSSYTTTLDIDSLGRIIVAGTISAGTDDIGVARFLTTGIADATFGTNGYSVFNISGLNDAATSMVLLADNKILIGGFADKGATGEDFLAVRVDSLGNLDSTFNNTGYVTAGATGIYDEEANGLAVMNDGRIILTGTLIFSSAINEDVLVIRLKPQIVNTGIEVYTAESNSMIYPNPCTHQINIRSIKNTSYIITDLQGRIISNFEAKVGNIVVDVNSFAPGVYLLKDINTGNTSRFVKM